MVAAAARRVRPARHRRADRAHARVDRRRGLQQRAADDAPRARTRRRRHADRAVPVGPRRRARAHHRREHHGRDGRPVRRPCRGWQVDPEIWIAGDDRCRCCRSCSSAARRSGCACGSAGRSAASRRCWTASSSPRRRARPRRARQAVRSAAAPPAAAPPAAAPPTAEARIDARLLDSPDSTVRTATTSLPRRRTAHPRLTDGPLFCRRRPPHLRRGRAGEPRPGRGGAAPHARRAAGDRPERRPRPGSDRRRRRAPPRRRAPTCRCGAGRRSRRAARAPSPARSRTTPGPRPSRTFGARSRWRAPSRRSAGSARGRTPSGRACRCFWCGSRPRRSTAGRGSRAESGETGERTAALAIAGGLAAFSLLTASAGRSRERRRGLVVSAVLMVAALAAYAGSSGGRSRAVRACSPLGSTRRWTASRPASQRIRPGPGTRRPSPSVAVPAPARLGAGLLDPGDDISDADPVRHTPHPRLIPCGPIPRPKSPTSSPAPPSGRPRGPSPRAKASRWTRSSASAPTPASTRPTCAPPRPNSTRPGGRSAGSRRRPGRRSSSSAGSTRRCRSKAGRTPSTCSASGVGVVDGGRARRPRPAETVQQVGGAFEWTHTSGLGIQTT